MVRMRNSVRVELKMDAADFVKQRFGRDFFVVDILQGVFKIQADEVFCLQEFAVSGFLDLTFFALKDCVVFFEAWKKKEDHKLLEGLQLQPVFIQDFIPLTIHVYNPFVEDGDVLALVKRYCEEVRGGEHLKDRFGIWNGKRRYMVKLKLDPSVQGSVLHPPGSFSIGPNKGFLYYPGQPLYCRRCGGQGHVKMDCKGERCRFCGESNHVAGICTAPKCCSLCGSDEHLYRGCPGRKKSYASLFKEGEDLLGDCKALVGERSRSSARQTVHAAEASKHRWERTAEGNKSHHRSEKSPVVEERLIEIISGDAEEPIKRSDQSEDGDNKMEVTGGRGRRRAVERDDCGEEGRERKCSKLEAAKTLASLEDLIDLQDELVDNWDWGECEEDEEGDSQEWTDVVARRVKAKGGGYSFGKKAL
uniref:CCHC-type domain-containing protein n=1 Tax=Cyprinus carpio TaxID=7962 RepID=A0A8C1S1M9_CYPCA